MHFFAHTLATVFRDPSNVRCCCAEAWHWWLTLGQRVGIIAQGFQRGLDSMGHVSPFSKPSQQLLVLPAMHPTCLCMHWFQGMIAQDSK